ncbi:sporulation protein YpjB [Ornithinibacillus salinisoli]|uniref:Sporulation protein YpjB n=1 Tax=Ornithinibacillus salinisoli TaxID=1848459 RepID=A0ABW4W493_9BACI
MINKHKRINSRWAIGIVFFWVVLCTAHPVLASEESSKENSEMIPFYWGVFIVGGCIAITLSYVSWRKYKGEKKIEQKKDKMID